MTNKIFCNFFRAHQWIPFNANLPVSFQDFLRHVHGAHNIN